MYSLKEAYLLARFVQVWEMRYGEGCQGCRGVGQAPIEHCIYYLVATCETRYCSYCKRLMHLFCCDCMYTYFTWEFWFPFLGWLKYVWGDLGSLAVILLYITTGEERMLSGCVSMVG